MRIIHFTSIAAAFSIMHSRTFHPAQANPYGGDAGLNAFDLDRPHNYEQNFAGGTDARLIFEWNGPVTEEADIPLPPNVLSDQMPFRVFVPIETDQHLRLIGFKTEPDAWNRYDVDLSWYYLTRPMRRWARRRILHKLRAEIAAIVASNPSISVTARSSINP